MCRVRGRSRPFAISMVLAAAPALVLALAQDGGQEREGAGFNPFAAATISGETGTRLPLDVPFVDASGHEVDLASMFADRPVILAPVYYQCPNVCSITLEGLMLGLRGVPLRPGRDYRVVAVSIDPREGPADAREAAARVRAVFAGDADADAFRFLTGPPASIRALTDAIGFGHAFDPDKQQYAHSAAIAAVTPDGRVARWLYGVRHDASDLHLALLEAGRGAITSVGDVLLMLCYRYDPRTGTYNSRVHAALAAGGGVVVLALGGFIGGSLWRERRRSR